MDEQKVYIIKSFDNVFSEKEGIHAVMDKDFNVICWSTEMNARQFILNHGMELKWSVVDKIKEELKQDIWDYNNSHNCFVGIRLIDTVEF